MYLFIFVIKDIYLYLYITDISAFMLLVICVTHYTMHRLKREIIDNSLGDHSLPKTAS